MFRLLFWIAKISNIEIFFIFANLLFFMIMTQNICKNKIHSWYFPENIYKFNLGKRICDLLYTS